MLNFEKDDVGSSACQEIMSALMICGTATLSPPLFPLGGEGDYLRFFTQLRFVPGPSSFARDSERDHANLVERVV
jgi:hypothetical protein